MSSHTKRAKRLKPTGHSAVIESLIQPAIVVGSTLMSAIAAYVLALDEITQILDGRGTPSDYFIVALCAGMGFLIDMAIIVSATRYKMHAVRADPSEVRWLTLAKWVLVIGLASETLTLFYFFVHLSARAFPGPLVDVADAIHSVLAVLRAFLPPIVIAYFAAGVLPVMFDRADRNREIKSRTSANIMLLIDKLSEVFDTDDKAEMLRALGGQLMLDTYATYDETARTTEDEQLRRDGKLLTHLARIHRLDWSAIAADVAPELGNTAPQIAPHIAPVTPVTQVFEHPNATRSNTPALPSPNMENGDDGPPDFEPDPPPKNRGSRPDGNRADAYRSNIRMQPQNSRVTAASMDTKNDTKNAPRRGRPPRPARADIGRPKTDREALRADRVAAAEKILASDPAIGTRALARRIAMATSHRCSESTAQEIRAEITGRALLKDAADIARQAADAIQ